jgi:hypothetical protein
LLILLYVTLVLTGIILILLYRQTKKRGFMLIGISFVLEVICNLIPNQAITDVLMNTFGMEEGQAFSTLLLINTSVQLVFAILVLIGVVLLRNEFKSKLTS